jgi:uncharacterized protein
MGGYWLGGRTANGWGVDAMSDPREILEEASTVAVVGCSTDPDKAGHRIPAQLQAAGYRIVPVHPSADEVLGEKAYRTLEEIPGPVDLVNVFRPAEEAPEIARAAAAIGAKALWLQVGIRSPEARRIAREAGMGYVEDRCSGTDRRWFGITKNG